MAGTTRESPSLPAPTCTCARRGRSTSQPRRRRDRPPTIQAAALQAIEIPTTSAFDAGASVEVGRRTRAGFHARAPFAWANVQSAAGRAQKKSAGGDQPGFISENHDFGPNLARRTAAGGVRLFYRRIQDERSRPEARRDEEPSSCQNGSETEGRYSRALERLTRRPQIPLQPLSTSGGVKTSPRGVPDRPGRRDRGRRGSPPVVPFDPPTPPRPRATASRPRDNRAAATPRLRGGASAVGRPSRITPGGACARPIEALSDRSNPHSWQKTCRRVKKLAVT